MHPHPYKNISDVNTALTVVPVHLVDLKALKDPFCLDRAFSILRYKSTNTRVAD